MRAILLGGLALVLVAYGVALHVGWSGSVWIYPLSTSASAAGALVGRGWRTPGRERNAWRLLVAGVTLYATGDVLWTVLFELRGSAGGVGWADLPYLAGAACLGLGALRLGSARLGGRVRRQLIDADEFGAALLLVLWEPVLEPTMAASGAPLLHVFVLAAYPLADIVFAAVRAARGPPRLPRPEQRAAARHERVLPPRRLRVRRDGLVGHLQRRDPARARRAWLLAALLVTAASLVAVRARVVDTTHAHRIARGPGWPCRPSRSSPRRWPWWRLAR